MDYFKELKSMYSKGREFARKAIDPSVIKDTIDNILLRIAFGSEETPQPKLHPSWMQIPGRPGLYVRIGEWKTRIYYRAQARVAAEYRAGFDEYLLHKKERKSFE